MASALIKSKSDKEMGLVRSKHLSAWILYSSILSLPNEDLTLNVIDNIIGSICDTFPTGDVKGVFLKEVNLSIEAVHLLIESRAGALKSIDVIATNHKKIIIRNKNVLAKTIRSALEFLAHIPRLFQKHGNPIRKGFNLIFKGCLGQRGCFIY